MRGMDGLLSLVDMLAATVLLELWTLALENVDGRVRVEEPKDRKKAIISKIGSKKNGRDRKYARLGGGLN